jgi:hypothetical protein
MMAATGLWARAKRRRWKRWKITDLQTATLEAAFARSEYPGHVECQAMAESLGCTQRQVIVWFRNHRDRSHRDRSHRDRKPPREASASTPTLVSPEAYIVALSMVGYLGPSGEACLPFAVGLLDLLGAAQREEIAAMAAYAVAMEVCVGAREYPEQVGRIVFGIHTLARQLASA